MDGSTKMIYITFGFAAICMVLGVAINSASSLDWNAGSVFESVEARESLPVDARSCITFVNEMEPLLTISDEDALVEAVTVKLNEWNISGEEMYELLDICTALSFEEGNGCCWRKVGGVNMDDRMVELWNTAWLDPDDEVADAAMAKWFELLHDPRAEVENDVDILEEVRC